MECVDRVGAGGIPGAERCSDGRQLRRRRREPGLLDRGRELGQGRLDLVDGDLAALSVRERAESGQVVVATL